jgi:homogentisate 1,2-dioxygenase
VVFPNGIHSVGGAGNPGMKNGMAISRYSFNLNMTTEDRRMAMYTADSDMLIVPCVGTLRITTEMGKMTVAKKEICVI